jgi:hypothetical protein
MSGQSTPPLLAQRAPQLCQQISATVIGVIRDLVRPQRYEPRQVARAAIGVSCGGRRHFAIRHAGRIACPGSPGISQRSCTNPAEMFDDRPPRRA